MLRNKSGNKSWNIYSSCNVLINVVNISADPLVDIFCQTSKERIFCRKNRRIEFHLLRMFKLQWADQNIRIFLHNSFLCLDDRLCLIIIRQTCCDISNKCLFFLFL